MQHALTLALDIVAIGGLGYIALAFVSHYSTWKAKRAATMPVQSAAVVEEIPPTPAVEVEETILSETAKLNAPAPQEEDLTTKTVAELRPLCKAAGIKWKEGKRFLKKAEMIAALLEKREAAVCA